MTGGPLQPTCVAEVERQLLATLDEAESAQLRTLLARVAGDRSER